MIKKLSMTFVIALIFNGCTAISEREAIESYSSNRIVYFEVNNPNMEFPQRELQANEINLCGLLMDDYCNSEYQKTLMRHNGNIKVTLTKILKMNVLIPKNIAVKKYDIIKARFISNNHKGLPIGHFIEVADPTDCHWDGSGVICKSGWDYRKDLPPAML